MQWNVRIDSFRPFYHGFICHRYLIRKNGLAENFKPSTKAMHRKCHTAATPNQLTVSAAIIPLCTGALCPIRIWQKSHRTQTRIIQLCRSELIRVGKINAKSDILVGTANFLALMDKGSFSYQHIVLMN
jgi:hypothetical protein